MPERLRVGVLGASWIADRALIPAMRTAASVEPVAIASRDPQRARRLAQRHGITGVLDSYEALLEERSVDCVYIGLVNSEHARWTVQALQAGKHVLCDKPLAMNADEARSMRDAAVAAQRSLMEGFMYRFHPRMRGLRERYPAPQFVHAAFSFPLADPGNYRMHAELGGGALLDAGCYTLDVIRWFLGEPASVRSVVRGTPVDTTVAASLSYVDGAQATAWASFEASEHQELVLLSDGGLQRASQPFTAWRDPEDPYAIMVEEFARSILDGAPPPRSIEDSIATAELIDRVRDAAKPLR